MSDTNANPPPTAAETSNTPDPTSDTPPPTSQPDTPTSDSPDPTTSTPPANTTPTDTSTPPPSTSTPPANTSTPDQSTQPPNEDQTSTTVVVVTRSQSNNASPTSSISSSTATPIGGGSGGGGGLSSGGKIAVAVVVPIAAVALLVAAGIFFWRRRKAKKDAEEERRKEVEDYAYHPNADPTIPAVGLASDGAYEMRDDATSGYRGWGSTTVGGSTGRKASTTMSGGVTGAAYSDAPSTARAGTISDTRSGEPLVDGSGSHSPEGEILGAMGPSAAANRGGDMRRGPSNASSSYSAAARSDGSGEVGGIGMAYGGNNNYYEQYGGGNPYAGDQMYGASPPNASELPSGQPIIRDNPARRNTRIESPSHYPQQSAGISQNF